MTKKRRYNEGSIFRLPSGRWCGQVSHNGHRQSKSFLTQKECIDWVRKNRNLISDGMSYTNAQITLADYLEGWLITKKNQRHLATWVHYNWLAHGYIIPALGNIKPKDLRAQQIQDLYNRLLQSGTGIPTVRKIHAVLIGVMNQAVKHEVILRNPVNLVEQPEITDTEMAILSETQISRFLVIANNHRLEVIFHLAITTGMRGSELLGLKWKVLDWIKQIIKVERQYERPHGEGVRFTPPKTKHGNRSNCFVPTTNANQTSELILVMPGKNTMSSFQLESVHPSTKVILCRVSSYYSKKLGYQTFDFMTFSTLQQACC